MTMPPQSGDATCTSCHPAAGGVLAVADAHLHPFDDPAFNTGVNVTIDSVGGGSGPGGRHQVGDPVVVGFSVEDDAGTDLHINQLTRFQMIVSGPSTNPQLILPNVNLFDFGFRKSTPFTGNGTITTTAWAGGTRQVVAVVFTSATTFDVVGSVDPPLLGQALGPVTYGGVTFTVAAGTTAFAANDPATASTTTSPSIASTSCADRPRRGTRPGAAIGTALTGLVEERPAPPRLLHRAGRGLGVPATLPGRAAPRQPPTRTLLFHGTAAAPAAR